MTIIEDYTAVFYDPTRWGAKVTDIVLHSMDGFYNGTISWFRNKNRSPGTSCHYLISKEGEIRRMVREEHNAFHAGVFNARSIGIELEDERKREKWVYPQVQIDALNWLVDDICKRYGIPKSRSRIHLHKDLDPSRRSDPVGNFNIEWVLSGNPGQLPNSGNPGGGTMDNAEFYKAALLRVGQVFGDQFNENWNADEKRVYREKTEQRVRDLHAHSKRLEQEVENLKKQLAEKPPVQTVPAQPVTLEAALAQVGRLLDERK